MTKEDIWTRYFFFFEDGLYKMFLAFNKDAIGGKNFQEFGKGMEAKYGHAKEVYRDDKTRGGVTHKLDHYEWSAGGGERLRLIDRSEFYGVYCLVLYDGSVQDRVNDRRKVVNPGEVKRDELVEGVTGKNSGSKGSDIDDDIIDRVVGKEAKKPGADQGKTPGHRRRLVQSARQGHGLVVGIGRRREEEGDGQQERVFFVLVLVLVLGREGFEEEGWQEGREPDGRARALDSPLPLRGSK